MCSRFFKQPSVRVFEPKIQPLPAEPASPFQAFAVSGDEHSGGMFGGLIQRGPLHSMGLGQIGEYQSVVLAEVGET